MVVEPGCGQICGKAVLLLVTMSVLSKQQEVIQLAPHSQTDLLHIQKILQHAVNKGIFHVVPLIHNLYHPLAVIYKD